MAAEPPCTEAPAAERRLRIAIVFAGDGEAEHALPRRLREQGHDVFAIDTKLGGWRHDVLRGDGAAWLVDAVRSGWFDAVFMAPPCSSFSVRHPVKLRSRASPEGVQPMPPEWAAYVRKHNRLAAFTAELMRDSSGAGWEEAADHGSLWRLRCIADALQEAGASSFTFAQCGRVRLPTGELLPLGSQAQKWTTMAASPWMARELEPLADALCEHGDAGHA